jgi:hypothetical protein
MERLRPQYTIIQRDRERLSDIGASLNIAYLTKEHKERNDS